MKTVLTKEIATRKNNLAHFSFTYYLPDPDEMLSKYNNPIAHYKKLMNDPHLSAVVLQRKAFVKSMLYELEEKPLTREINLLLNGLNIKKLINQSLDAVYFGLTVHEIVWEFLKGKYVPKTIEEKPQDWFAFDVENNFKMKNPKNLYQLIDLPEYKFILSQNNPTYMNPYGEKLVKKCYWNVKFKAQGLEYWSYFVEKYGMPFLVGELGSAAYDSKSAEFLEQLVSMKKNGVMVKREGAKLELIESGSKVGSTSAYKEFIQFQNAEISEAILTVSTSTNDKGTGSYAKSKTEKEIIEVVADGDKSIVEAFINKLIEFYCLLNHGKVDYPKIMFFSKKEVDKELADRDKVLTDQGVKFTKEYYKGSYNLKETDFELKNEEIVGVN